MKIWRYSWINLFRLSFDFSKLKPYAHQTYIFQRYNRSKASTTNEYHYPRFLIGLILCYLYSTTASVNMRQWSFIFKKYSFINQFYTKSYSLFVLFKTEPSCNLLFRPMFTKSRILRESVLIAPDENKTHHSSLSLSHIIHNLNITLRWRDAKARVNIWHWLTRKR